MILNYNESDDIKEKKQNGSAENNQSQMQLYDKPDRDG